MTDDFEPFHAASPTERICQDLELHGYHPAIGEPDSQPAPEDKALLVATQDIFDALVSSATDTLIEPDLDDLLWGAVHLLHRTLGKIERRLDDNEQAQKRSQREQDGSEVRSVELEHLLMEGETLLARRDALEAFRDHAAEAFERHTHTAWRPLSGSRTSRRALTSALLDSREFLAAKRRAEIEPLTPAGPKVAFTGGPEFNDHRLIWDKLDQVHAKHPDMVLLHGGTPKGAELIAAKWADARKIAQIAFKPDWTRHAKAAPFKRNDLMLDTLPIGVVVFPGTGIQDNLADKARKLGIPVWRFGP